MDWNNIWENTISGILVVIFGGISAWLVYSLGIKGKEKSQLASQRKQNIYIPLKYEMKNITDMEYDIWKEITIPECDSVLEKNDELVVSSDLYTKCSSLRNLINQYNSINMYGVVTDILLNRFKEKYAQLYGSTTHIEHICQPDFEDDIDVTDYEIQNFYETINQKSVISNIMKNDMGYEEYCFQEQFVSPFEEYFSRLCASVLPRGEQTYKGVIVDDESLKRKRKTPAEFIAYGFNFFQVYNNNPKVCEKKKLLDEVKEQALDIFEDLSIVIRNIGKKYEKEQDMFTTKIRRTLV